MKEPAKGTPTISETRGYDASSGEGHSQIPEHLLAKLRQKRAARQHAFRTQGAQQVRVLYPGRSGTTAGPDFWNALLEIESVGLVQSDVEIHIRQQDWDSHGHGTDPNYDGVILSAAMDVTGERITLQRSGDAGGEPVRHAG